MPLKLFKGLFRMKMSPTVTIVRVCTLLYNVSMFPVQRGERDPSSLIINAGLQINCIFFYQ